MDSAVLEAILLPWWKLVIYMATVTLGIIAVRISIKFDVNKWLKTRNEAKRIKDREKASRNCKHIWTLYTNSPYSRCDNCLVLISTSILVAARAGLNPKPVISGHTSLLMTPGADELVTSGYIGDRK